MQIQEIEKELAFIKSDSTHQLKHFFLKLNLNQYEFYVNVREIQLD